jgi:cation diffusion facilitator family transporter
VGNGLHIWSDVLTSAGVVAGVVLAQLTGWWILDPILAILVALNILRVGSALILESVGGLLDHAMPPDEEAHIIEVVSLHLDGALRAHGFRTRHAGPVAFVEFHLEVPARMTTGAAHSICDRLEQALAAAVPNCRAVIHVEPIEDTAAYPTHEAGTAPRRI